VRWLWLLRRHCTVHHHRPPAGFAAVVGHEGVVQHGDAACPAGGQQPREPGHLPGRLRDPVRRPAGPTNSSCMSITTSAAWSGMSRNSATPLSVGPPRQRHHLVLGELPCHRRSPPGGALQAPTSAMNRQVSERICLEQLQAFRLPTVRNGHLPPQERPADRRGTGPGGVFVRCAVDGNRVWARGICRSSAGLLPGCPRSAVPAWEPRAVSSLRLP
jgi:hypothetical protein